MLGQEWKALNGIRIYVVSKECDVDNVKVQWIYTNT